MNALAERSDRRMLEQLPDETVVGRVLAGDVALFELIMRRHNRRLFRIARVILCDDGEAEDAVQEAYVHAYLKLGQFRGPQGFASWLCRIATNEALMRRRARGSVTLVALETLDEAQHQESAAADRDAPTMNPEVAMYESELLRLLERAIDALPDAYRAAFALREIEQFSVDETAACLGIEAATVKTRVHRARRLLQRRLKSELAKALPHIHAFEGDRCDRLVHAVFQRLGALPRR